MGCCGSKQRKVKKSTFAFISVSSHNVKGDKSNAQVELIFDLLSKNSYFQPFTESWPREDLRLLVDAFEFVSLDHGERLSAVGEPSNDVYILLSGKLSVFNAAGGFIADIEPIAVVGELGFFKNAPRSASMFSHEDCNSNLWKLSRDNYNKLMDRPEYILSKLTIFATLSRSSKRIIAGYAVLKRYPAKTVFAKRGDVVTDKISFVISGHVQAEDGVMINRGNYFGSQQVSVTITGNNC